MPRGNATERRKNVQLILRNKYGSFFTNEIIEESAFYLSVNDTLVSVCAPGNRNNMLDRGQLQFMAFGCCTISPNLLTTLSWDQQPIPDFHYIKCSDDYSDIIEKIEWVKKNPEMAIQIGLNAKELFSKTSLPIVQVEWIKNLIT